MLETIHPSNCIRSNPSCIIFDFAKSFLLDLISLRLTAKSVLPNDLQLLLAHDGSLWLSNPSTEKVDFGPAELCGYGQGTLNDKPVSKGLRKHDNYIGHVPGCLFETICFSRILTSDT